MNRRQVRLVLLLLLLNVPTMVHATNVRRTEQLILVMIVQKPSTGRHRHVAQLRVPQLIVLAQPTHLILRIRHDDRSLVRGRFVHKLQKQLPLVLRRLQRTRLDQILQIFRRVRLNAPSTTAMVVQLLMKLPTRRSRSRPANIIHQQPVRQMARKIRPQQGTVDVLLIARIRRRNRYKVQRPVLDVLNRTQYALGQILLQVVAPASAGTKFQMLVGLLHVCYCFCLLQGRRRDGE
uniref:(northern house mosquito) hypothetical protein n=1 Tax=Culex pipiens TaxID=7175 RepID=A0A8D8JDT4_CULPI